MEGVDDGVISPCEPDRLQALEPNNNATSDPPRPAFHPGHFICFILTNFSCFTNPIPLTSFLMSVSDSDATMAVFLDLENLALGAQDAQFQAFAVRKVIERLLLKGHIVVKKAYCDFDRYKAFKRGLHETAFELIEIPHVRHSGKNSADIRMVVDALDLCYTKSHVDT